MSVLLLADAFGGEKRVLWEVERVIEHPSEREAIEGAEEQFGLDGGVLRHEVRITAVHCVREPFDSSLVMTEEPLPSAICWRIGSKRSQHIHPREL